MNLRLYRPEDNPKIIKLWKETKLVEEDCTADILCHYQRFPDLMIIGEVDSCLVATCFAGYIGHRGFVFDLAILDRFQRKGYATLMLDAINKKLHVKGCRETTVLVSNINSAAISFYRRLGFTTIPVTVMRTVIPTNGL
ncbi:GNAT family N-acetyltransferase [Planctomycetota bacterium]